MIQTFDATTSPDQGPPRLAKLREAMAEAGLQGFLVPRADVHQGEYVADCDDRLAWLTGFTGSAGFCAVLPDLAGVFIDGRYRVQVHAQVAPDFTPVHWPEVSLAEWLRENLPEGTLGFDPQLHTVRELAALRKALENHPVTLTPCENLIDQIWEDRPAPPSAKAEAFPLEFAGETSGDKRARLAAELRAKGQDAAVITLPDSIMWLLNIRGRDIPRNPIMQCFAILHSTGKVDLFTDPAKLDALGPDPAITVQPQAAFWAALARLRGTVRIAPNSAPVAVETALSCDVVHADDPCVLPKACKNPTEIAGMRAAHQRDAVAMVEFLAWLDAQPPSSLTEIDVVKTLEGFRAASNMFRDVSFETISGANANGAIVHYRVTEDTNATVEPGLLLVDSGGQYLDGTTDITRTIAIGPPQSAHCHCFTRVLQGMIALSQARFPKGVTGRDLDSLARMPLWRDGMDYDHGTGHGVGAYLSVHEGPVGISRRAPLIPLQEGMILSNEPGYYREGAFGIRIENLIVTRKAPALPTADAQREMLDFETLTHVPIDRRLIDTALLAPSEKEWIDAYHATCAAQLEGQLSETAASWLRTATLPL